MQQLWGASHDTAVGLADRLVPEADPQDGDVAGQRADHRDADPGLRGSARAGREQHAVEPRPESGPTASLRRTSTAAPSWARYWTRLNTKLS